MFGNQGPSINLRINYNRTSNPYTNFQNEPLASSIYVKNTRLSLNEGKST